MVVTSVGAVNGTISISQGVATNVTVEFLDATMQDALGDEADEFQVTIVGTGGIKFTRPGPFASVICNEGELLERFGVEVETIALETVVARVAGIEESPQAAREASEIASRVRVEGVEQEAVRRLAALKIALRDWAAEQRLDALAVQFWSAMQHALGVWPCFVHGELTDLGVPMACETDIHGALTAIAAQAAAMGGTAPFFADLTVRHPENDNAELLWHCGPFPLSLADPESEPKMGGHFVGGAPAVGHWRIRGGPVTLARLDGDHGDYRMMMGHADGCDGPPTHGTYLWVQVGDWPAWEERLVCGPYIHHIVGVHGRLAPVLYEACKYLGVTPDPFEPTEAQIRAWLRGGEMP